MNHYLALGVAENATTEDIKKAYRALAFDCHPDRNPGNPVKEARFKEISAAWEILGDVAERQAYDASLRRMRQGAWPFSPGAATPAGPPWVAPNPRPPNAAQPWARAPSQSAGRPASAAIPTANPSLPRTADGDLGKAVACALLQFGIGALLAAIFDGGSSGHRGRGGWDAGVQRRRGSDGRFRKT